MELIEKYVAIAARDTNEGKGRIRRLILSGIEAYYASSASASATVAPLAAGEQVQSDIETLRAKVQEYETEMKAAREKFASYENQMTEELASRKKGCIRMAEGGVGVTVLLTPLPIDLVQQDEIVSTLRKHGLDRIRVGNRFCAQLRQNNEGTGSYIASESWCCCCQQSFCFIVCSCCRVKCSCNCSSVSIRCCCSHPECISCTCSSVSAAPGDSFV
jgi:hypothetical protein